MMSSQLNSPELLKLTGLPARLIVALYEHISVEERCKNSMSQAYPGKYHLAMANTVTTMLRATILTYKGPISILNIQVVQISDLQTHNMSLLEVF